MDRATAIVRLRRTGAFDGKVKPESEAVDGMTVHLRGAGVCEGHSLYEGEDRWDVDFRVHDIKNWPDDGPVWFAAGDLFEIKSKEGQSDGT